MGKDAVFTMKLESDLRADFMTEAEALHRPASQVVRDFMRDFVAQKRAQREHGAFVASKVALARASVQADRGYDQDDVEAAFADRRARFRISK
jgi:hypothetical protein